MDSFGSGGGPGGEPAYGSSGDRRSAGPPQRGQNFGDDRSNVRGPSTAPALAPPQRDSSGSRSGPNFSSSCAPRSNPTSSYQQRDRGGSYSGGKASRDRDRQSCRSDYQSGDRNRDRGRSPSPLTRRRSPSPPRYSRNRGRSYSRSRSRSYSR